MRLSGLVITLILSVPTLFGQHTSGVASGSSSSSPSSSTSSSSVSSSSSPNSGASHSSSASSSSSSSGSSVSSHSSGGPSSAGGSGSVSSHTSSSSASHVASTGVVESRSNMQSSRSNERVLREPNPEPNRKAPVGIGKVNPPSVSKLPPKEMPRTETKAAPEKRSLVSHLRHPFKPKPVTIAEFKRPVPCRKGHCPACPPGESRDGKGVCVGAAVASVASNECALGQIWNGGACVPGTTCQPGTFWNGASCAVNGPGCAVYESRAAAMSSELRSIKIDMDRACTQDPMGQQCLEFTMQHDGALLRYRGLLTEAPSSCWGLMPDPLSL
jgi:hypothetical protein